jgi:hypothetical protein
MKPKTCYMCDSQATGDEHVPPQCVFPKEGVYRKNLIKVPSCDEHNSGRSKNDEYLKFILTAVGEKNELAQDVFKSVMRSLDYRPHLIDTFTPDLQPVQIDGVETGGFTLDYFRFTNSMSALVRGLFFHEYGRKLNCQISGAAFSQVRTQNYVRAPFLKSILDAELQLPANYVGENPRVFQYAFNISSSGKTEMCRLRFYEAQPICVTWKNAAKIQTQ